LANTTYEQMIWSLYNEELQKQWNQNKTVKESSMIHQPEVDLEKNWALDYYVWQAVYLLNGGSGTRHHNPFTTQVFVHSDLQVLN
jgi:hypothetical protein